MACASMMANEIPVRTPPGPEVLSSAQLATDQLGKQILAGNYQYSLAKMYPRWKRRAAKQNGGMESLLKALEGIQEKMRKHGITMLSFEAKKPTSGHEVWLENKSYGQWMVFVPTLTRYRVVDAKTGKVLRIEREGYQIALRDKTSSEWTFMDGGNTSLKDLRSLFPTLPMDVKVLKLPPVGEREVAQ